MSGEQRFVEALHRRCHLRTQGVDQADDPEQGQVHKVFFGQLVIRAQGDFAVGHRQHPVALARQGLDLGLHCVGVQGQVAVRARHPHAHGLQPFPGPLDRGDGTALLAVRAGGGAHRGAIGALGFEAETGQGGIGVGERLLLQAGLARQYQQRDIYRIAVGGPVAVAVAKKGLVG